MAVKPVLCPMVNMTESDSQRGRASRPPPMRADAQPLAGLGTGQAPERGADLNSASKLVRVWQGSSGASATPYAD